MAQSTSTPTSTPTPSAAASSSTQASAPPPANTQSATQPVTPAGNTPASTTQINQPLPTQDERESIAKSLEELAKSYRQGHADTHAHEHAQNLQKKGVLENLKSFMPLFIAGQAKAIKERDAKK